MIRTANKPIHRAPETRARSDNCEKHNNLSTQAYSFLEVDLRRLRTENARRQMIPVIRIYLLHLQKANTSRPKNLSYNKNEPKQYTNTWQITEASNSTKRHANGNHADL